MRAGISVLQDEGCPLYDLYSHDGEFYGKCIAAFCPEFFGYGNGCGGNFEDNEIDLFGDAYEFLISNYAANAGKSGGEFFTPQNVSKLIAQLAMWD